MHGKNVRKSWKTNERLGKKKSTNLKTPKGQFS